MELPIVVYSHLRWDSLLQRPQDLMARLALERKVIFVEEPVPSKHRVPDSWELEWLEGDLVVARAHLPLEQPGFPAGETRLERMTQALLRSLAVEHHAAWLYTPAATRLALALNPRRVVYDCIDDLRSLRGAPPEIALREAELLRAADAVFRGGAGLDRARRALQPDALCVPSSVDADVRIARSGAAGARAPRLPRPPR